MNRIQAGEHIADMLARNGSYSNPTELSEAVKQSGSVLYEAIREAYGHAPGRAVIAVNACEVDALSETLLEPLWHLWSDLPIACFWIDRNTIDVGHQIRIAHIRQNYFDPMPESPYDIYFVSTVLDWHEELRAMYENFGGRIEVAAIKAFSMFSDLDLSFSASDNTQRFVEVNSVFSLQELQRPTASEGPLTAYRSLRRGLEEMPAPFLPRTILERVERFAEVPRFDPNLNRGSGSKFGLGD